MLAAGEEGGQGSKGKGGAELELDFLDDDEAGGLEGGLGMQGGQRAGEAAGGRQNEAAVAVGGMMSAPTQFLTDRGYGWLLEVDESAEAEGEGLSLLEELDIDVWDIAYKIRCVVLPFRFDKSIILTQTDFWGPFFVVLAYALLSLWGNMAVLSWILTIWAVGSGLIFLIARSLGGNVSYGQVLGVVGYSLIPLIVMVAAEPLLHAAGGESAFVLGRAFAVVWAAYSAGSLLVTEELMRRRFLVMYPIFLLYVYFVSLHSGA
ncbi:YIPF4 protein [Thecamonas trahens ATCC 50062]|uniref:Protein YIPF n=1 Tax=Thecamonas trahens ATCC 50062 TaxID=461836 RepID=A0A0L0DBS6_THETB|nr:YIPF4 protein [Thecamonas trahens ATCC 50062]KNC49546.1 YIPF4 protein [Thecamonas trahens ATCC 50062]|eukprot:XP_013757657.1 YIPF4 protein [Thecamonas trahens ATCC 50062]